MRQAQAALEEHLERRKLTRGMTVRIHGDHPVVGRPVPGSDATSEQCDQISLTQLGASSWGLSVNRTPGAGSRPSSPAACPSEMVETVRAISSIWSPPEAGTRPCLPRQRENCRMPKATHTSCSPSQNAGQPW